MISVSEFNDFERLESFRLLWKSLLQKTPQPSFFKSFDWLESYWKACGADQRLRVLLVSLAGKPIGLVPLVVKRAVSPVGRIHVLTYPLDEWGMFYGPIGPNPAATLHAAMRYLEDSPRDWDLLDLRYVDTDGNDRGRTRNALRAAGLHAYGNSWRTASRVDLNENWMEFWAKRPASLREKYTDAESRLSRKGDVRFERYRPEGATWGDSEPCWRFYNHFERLCLDHVGSTSSERPERRRVKRQRCLRTAHRAAVRSGAVDMNLLYLNGTPVACAYNYHANGVVEGVRLVVSSEYDADFETVLLGRMLKDSFLLGDESYLFPLDRLHSGVEWRTSVATSYRYTHFAATGPRAQILRMNYRLRSWLGEDALPTNVHDSYIADRRSHASGESIATNLISGSA